MLVTPKKKVGPATTQNLVVKFDGEICGGVLVENFSDDFPSKRGAPDGVATLKVRQGAFDASNKGSGPLEK